MATDELVNPDPAPPRALAWAIAVGFVGLIAAVAFVDTLWPAPPIRLVGAEQARAYRASRDRSPWDGSLARWLESRHEQRSRTKRAVVPWWSALILRYAPQNHGDLIVGAGGWLFLRNRAEPPAESTASLVTHGVHALSAVSRALASHGYTLIAMPVPRKSVICAARLPRGVDARPEIDRRTLALLAERGVATLDLLEAWAGHDPDTLYLSHDSHWQFDGRRLAAEALVAAYPALAGERYDVQALSQASSVPQVDLLSFAGIPPRHPAVAWVQPGPGVDTLLEPRALHDRVVGYRGPAALLIAGTSFSASNDFPRLVLAATRDEVLVAAFGGAQFLEPLARVAVPLGSDPGQGPRWILYEFPLSQIWDPTARWNFAHGMFGKFFLHLPARALHPLGVRGALTQARAPRDTTVARVVPGSVCSTGEGLVQLRLRAADAAAVEGTDWTLESSGSQFRFTWPAGRQEVALPWIEGPEPTGECVLRGADQRALRAAVSAELATDLALEHAVPLRPAAHTAGGTQLECAGIEVPAGAGLLLTIAPAGSAAGPALGQVVVRAEAQDGRTLTWTLPARAGTLLVVGLDGLRGAALASLEVRGAPIAEARLAPADWPAERPAR